MVKIFIFVAFSRFRLFQRVGHLEAIFTTNFKFLLKTAHWISGSFVAELFRYSNPRKYQNSFQNKFQKQPKQKITKQHQKVKKFAVLKKPLPPKLLFSH